MTVEVPQSQESLKVFPISEFNGELLSHLTNWTPMNLENGRRWLFTFEDQTREDVEYTFHVRKAAGSGDSTQDLVNVNFKSGDFAHSVDLVGVKTFSVGTSGSGEKGEEPLVRFCDENRGLIEVRNSGIIVTREITRSVQVPFSGTHLRKELSPDQPTILTH